MRSKYLCLIALFALFLGSCNKEDDGFVDAVVEDSGDMSSQGCGYLLRFNDGRLEKPYQLKTMFQSNGMKVRVKYHPSDIFETCSYGQLYEYNLVIIDDIKIRQQ